MDNTELGTNGIGDLNEDIYTELRGQSKQWALEVEYFVTRGKLFPLTKVCCWF